MVNEYLVNSSDMTAVADAIRAKGGTSEALAFPNGFVEALGAIQAGTGGSGSGNAIQIGQNTNTPNFLNLFWALENGTAKTGEFTLSSFLPNTETLILDSGLSSINGLFYVDADYTYTAAGSTPEYGAWGLYMDNPNRVKPVYCCGFGSYNASGYYVVVATDFITRGSSRFDGGKLYVTATYNNHSGYTPFYKGHRYVWVAW